MGHCPRLIRMSLARAVHCFLPESIVFFLSAGGGDPDSITLFTCIRLRDLHPSPRFLLTKSASKSHISIN